jgi:hypothetical protein
MPERREKYSHQMGRHRALPMGEKNYNFMYDYVTAAERGGGGGDRGAATGI